jgi:putative transposase
MCEMLEVAKSSYYEWWSNPISKRFSRYRQLDILIESIFIEHQERYGSTRIYHELKYRGIACTRKIVAKRMKLIGLTAKARRKFKVTTDSNHNKPVALNLLEQNFTAAAPNQKWATDITYIHTKEGWLYLCVFIDLYSRAVIGWSMSKTLRATLVTDALLMAMFRRKLPQRVIVHSDRGSQYCSSAYQDLIKRYNLQCSMSAKGCCYDNAAMESFFHTIKVELINDMRYQTREIAKSSIVEYIECYYNRKRRHSTIAYNIPVLFEQNLLSIA